MQAYSDPTRQNDPHALPDLEIFELTASEVAELDEDTIQEYSRRHEFRLASMNGAIRARMIDAIIAEQGVTGGWFWQACFPGCMPDGEPTGPYKTAKEALSAARDE